MNITKTLDCVGLFCPMPIVKTSQELDIMKPGEILEVTADDPGFEKDLPAWCKNAGQEFVELKKEGPYLKGYVKKA
ncbi:sulfurtransferase TusA family protein [Elusimicrobiota bacterium]